MQIRETYVNGTEGYQFGQSGWLEPYADSRGQLFLDLQREYGGCISRMYQDVPKPDTAHNPLPARPIASRRDYTTQACGWVFSRREQYEDSNPRWDDYGNRIPPETYIREVWVEVRGL